MPKKFIELGLKYYNGEEIKYEPSKNCKRKVECEGIIYKSVTDCAKFYTSDRRMLSRYLNGEVKMKQIWIDRGLKYN